MSPVEKRKQYLLSRLSRFGIYPSDDRLATLEQLYITAMCNKARVVTAELNVEME